MKLVEVFLLSKVTIQHLLVRLVPKQVVLTLMTLMAFDLLELLAYFLFRVRNRRIK